MFSFFAGPALIATAATLSVALPSAAQTMPSTSMPAAAAAARPDSGDPRASVPPVSYRSAFAGYRPNVEEKVGSWKDANDRVGRIGGWRAYAKEARQPERPTEGSAEMPASHGGNKKE